MKELLGGRRLRSRGPDPLLDDREVITMELVGEFLGIDTEKGLFAFFLRHYAPWFPALAGGCTAPPSPARGGQARWSVKKRLLWKALVGKIEHDSAICLVDSFAVPVCSFAKAPRPRSFAGTAERGYDAMTRSVFYGFEGHLRVCSGRG